MIDAKEKESFPAASTQPQRIDHELNVCGLSCPGPLIQVKQKMDQLSNGETLRVKASDPGFYEDVKAWATMSGSTILQLERLKGGTIESVIAKNTAQPVSNAPISDPASTMVVFSGDLTKRSLHSLLQMGQQPVDGK